MQRGEQYLAIQMMMTTLTNSFLLDLFGFVTNFWITDLIYHLILRSHSTIWIFSVFFRLFTERIHSFLLNNLAEQLICCTISKLSKIRFLFTSLRFKIENRLLPKFKYSLEVRSLVFIQHNPLRSYKLKWAVNRWDTLIQVDQSKMSPEIHLLYIFIKKLKCKLLWSSMVLFCVTAVDVAVSTACTHTRALKVKTRKIHANCLMICFGSDHATATLFRNTTQFYSYLYPHARSTTNFFCESVNTPPINKLLLHNGRREKERTTKMRTNFPKHDENVLWTARQW